MQIIRLDYWLSRCLVISILHFIYIARILLTFTPAYHQTLARLAKRVSTRLFFSNSASQIYVDGFEALCFWFMQKTKSFFWTSHASISSYRTCPWHGSFLQLVWLIFLAIRLYGFKLHVINWSTYTSKCMHESDRIILISEFRQIYALRN